MRDLFFAADALLSALPEAVKAGEKKPQKWMDDPGFALTQRFWESLSLKLSPETAQGQGMRKTDGKMLVVVLRHTPSILFALVFVTFGLPAPRFLSYQIPGPVVQSREQ